MGTRGPTWYRFGNVLLSRKPKNVVVRKSSIFPQLWQGAKHEQSSSTHSRVNKRVQQILLKEKRYYEKNINELFMFAVLNTETNFTKKMYVI